MEKKIVGLNTYFKSLEYENFDEYFSVAENSTILGKIRQWRIEDCKYAQ